MKTAELLNISEKEYFHNLYEKHNISYLMVDEDGVIFKEEELPKFFNSLDSPEINLEKVLQLRKITSTILKRIKFNYTIECSFNNNEVKIKLQFLE